jgi:uncharacterized membrane protein
MGENHFSKWPVLLYGAVLLMADFAYFILSQCLTNTNGKDSELAQAIGKDKKGIISIILYIIGIACSFINSWIGFSIYVIVAAIWFIPDRRIEKK